MGLILNFALLLCYLIIFLLILFYSVGKGGISLDIYERKIIKGLSLMELLVAIVYVVFLGINQVSVVAEKLKSKHRYSEKILDLIDHK